MWRIPLSLIAGQGQIDVSITSDTLVGDLYTFLGSPPGQVDVVVTVDAAMAGNIVITTDFATGSTFTVNVINGGMVVGLGGNGGGGGITYGTTGEAGQRGFDGGPAIESAYDIDLDIDNGFLFGGGGGGGGGSFAVDGTVGVAGGGGGGGRGFSTTAGGLPGDNGTPVPASQGGQGGPSGFGIGGAPSGTGLLNLMLGGNGGDWGSAGVSGTSSDLLGAGGTLFYSGGIGGKAGEAFKSNAGATVTYTGAKTEATLRTEGRIYGETDPERIDLLRFFQGEISTTTSAVAMTLATTGFRFDSNGNLVFLDSFNGNTVNTDQWLSATAVGRGADYDIRVRAFTPSEDQSGVWDTFPGTQGNWFNLASNREYSFATTTSPTYVASLIEIRRSDLPAGAPDANHLQSAFFIARRDDS